MKMPTSLICAGALLCFALLASASDSSSTIATAAASAKAEATGGGNAQAAAVSQATAGGAVATKAEGQALVKGGEGSSASAAAGANAKVETKGDTKAPCCKVDARAESAWWAYVLKCDNERYDPKKTTPGECATLSGNLCSQDRVVKCCADKTEFLANGKVAATGDHKKLKICDPAGACRP